MKVFNIQMEDDFHRELFEGANAVDSSAAKFVRDAIREKIARDIYGVEHVPTLRRIRHGIIGPVPDASGSQASVRHSNDRPERPPSADQSTKRPSVAELFALHNERKKEREKAA